MPAYNVDDARPQVKPLMADKKNPPEEWWSTSIIEMQPGMIRYRGYAVEELIGHIGFADMVWL